MAVPVMDGDTGKLEDMVSRGEGRATLRLKKDGQAVVEDVVRGFIVYIDLSKPYTSSIDL